MNRNMAYIYANLTSTNPVKYTMYTFKDKNCQKPSHEDRPITVDCSQANVVTGGFECDGSKSPLGLTCRRQEDIYNKVKKQVAVNKNSAVGYVLLNGMLLLLLLL